MIRNRSLYSRTCTRGMPSNRVWFTDDPSTIDAFQVMHNHSPSCSIFWVNLRASLQLRFVLAELSRCDDAGMIRGRC